VNPWVRRELAEQAKAAGPEARPEKRRTKRIRLKAKDGRWIKARPQRSGAPFYADHLPQGVVPRYA
jgi:hypothetical protein